MNTLTYELTGLSIEGRYIGKTVTTTGNVTVPVWHKFEWGDTDTYYWQTWLVSFMKDCATSGILTIENFESWWNNTYSITLQRYADYLMIDLDHLNRFLLALNHRPNKVTFGAILAFWDREHIMLTAMRDGRRIIYNPRHFLTLTTKYYVSKPTDDGQGNLTVPAYNSLGAVSIPYACIAKIWAETPLALLQETNRQINEIRRVISDTTAYIARYPQGNSVDYWLSKTVGASIFQIADLAAKLNISLPILIS